MDCSKCIFSIDKDGLQEDCQAGRIKKFIQKGKAERPEGKSHYHLNQFCNLYRIEAVSDEPLVEAKNQIDITAGLVVLDDPAMTIDDLCKTTDSICEAIEEYKNNKVAIVFSLGVNRRGEQVVELVNKYQAKGIRCQAVVHQYLFNARIRETEAFQKLASVNWMGTVKSGETIKKNTFTSINKSINEELNQFVCFESNNSLLLFSNLVKSQYLNYEGFEDMANAIKDFCLKNEVLGVI